MSANTVSSHARPAIFIESSKDVQPRPEQSDRLGASKKCKKRSLRWGSASEIDSSNAPLKAQVKLEPCSDAGQGRIKNRTSATAVKASRMNRRANNGETRRPALDVYLPLGSLTYVSVPGVRLTNEWVEGSSASDVLPDEHPLFSDVDILVTVGWVRAFVRRNDKDDYAATTKFYLLPDDAGQTFLHRNARTSRKSMIKLLQHVDRTKEAWDGNVSAFQNPTFYRTETSDRESLFQIFKTLHSPHPETSDILEEPTRNLIEGLLRGSLLVPGLKSKLYPYQQRSAAMMMQKESQPGLLLDPRLEAVQGPTGCQIYLDGVARLVLTTPCEYEEPRGGILAESMGYGKSLICLVVILQTKGYMPQIPPECSTIPQGSGSVRTLADMAASTIARSGIHWKPYFQTLSASGEDYERCIRTLERNAGFYYESANAMTVSRTRSSLAAERAPNRKVFLSSTTLIIVPANLLWQWQRELDTHIEYGSLSVVVVKPDEQNFPEVPELLEYDIVLVSRPRFEKHIMELKRGEYAAPSGGLSIIHNIHFLRLIVDEGHNFVSSNTSAATDYLKDLRFERKWIVSGTPSGGLIGADVVLAAGTIEDTFAAEDQPVNHMQRRGKKDAALEQERKDIENLGNIVVNFLGAKPWANIKSGDDSASWNNYMMPDGKGKRKAATLRSTLESLVIRHQITDIEKDLVLPPLHSRVVYLEPCFFDKLSMNLFIMVLTANAITSERVDKDYMFHESNRSKLDKLFNNLRQSSFYLWTGFSVKDVEECIRISRGYLLKTDTGASQADRALLKDVIDMGLTFLGSDAWKDFSQRNEMGLYVDNFPATQFQNYKSLDRLHSSRCSHWDGDQPPLRKYDAANGWTDGPLVRAIEGADLVGTASSKLSYLLNRITALEQEEKILVFYEGDHIAFYIAEALDYVNVEYLIYTNKLKQARRDEYIMTFRTSQAVRVLLMDLRQAARGLHVATASRIFFVSPVWQPSVEAQAIKRAHRIGQTRPVFVETLVLKDTLEERMMQRKKGMTSSEQRKATKNPLDDNTMNGIIKTARFIPFAPEELFGEPNQIARLDNPLQLYHRDQKLQRCRVIYEGSVMPVEDITKNGWFPKSHFLTGRFTLLLSTPSEKRQAPSEPSHGNGSDEPPKKKRVVMFADEV